MMDINNSIYKIRLLDELSQKNSLVHQLNPLVKLIVTIIFIIITVSFGKYEIIGLLPLLVYPIAIFNAGDVPVTPILKRSLIVLPLIIGFGIFNPIFDLKLIYISSDIVIKAGWISFLSLMIKSYLCVICSLLLISTTSIDNISKALLKLHIPKIIVMNFLFSYRYIYVLLEEVSNIWTAYSLRAPMQKGIDYKVWGPLLGQLLIRTFDRAERIYIAMKLRGFNGEYINGSKDNFKLNDYLYLFFWFLFLLMVKFYNIPVLLGNIFIGA